MLLNMPRVEKSSPVFNAAFMLIGSAETATQTSKQITKLDV